jgi:multiple sugar transport system substrate-binding protein
MGERLRKSTGIDRRAFLKAVTGAAAASPFAGVGGATRKAYAQRVRLRFLTATAYPEFQKVFQSQAERYSKQTPNVEVSVDLAGWEEVVAKSAKAFAGGTPYDVTEVPSDETFFNLQQKGLYAPVTDLVRELGGDRYFVPNILGFAQHKGEYWGLPLRQTVLVHWYHKAWYDEAGLKWPGSWDEFLRKAKTLTDPQKERYGAMVPLATAYFPSTWVVSLIWMNGGHIVDAGGQVAFDSPATYEAIEFVRKLWEYAPPGSAQYNAPEMRSTFIQGKVADTYYSSFLLPSDVEKFNPGLAGKVDIAPLVPSKAGGEIMARMTGAYMTISAKTPHPKEARDFARYLVQPDNLIEWNSGLMESQAFTIHAALKSDRVLSHPMVRKYQDWFVRYQEYAQKHGRPVTQENKGVVTPKTAEILGDLLLAKCLQEVILQKQDVEKTVKKYAELMRKVVARPA